jgi:hypothetical protein
MASYHGQGEPITAPLLLHQVLVPTAPYAPLPDTIVMAACSL